MTYRQMLHQLNRSWGILCIIPFAAFITMLYVVNNFTTSASILVLVYGLLVVSSGAYYLMYLFFDRVQKENSARYEAQLSTLQVSALRSRMEAVRAAENRIRTERHDLRHRLQTLMELVARGERETALDFLDAAQKRLDKPKEIRWCRPPVLDAVFSSYFEQAKNQDISVEAKISLPDNLPADEGELAIVLANALENAIHANLELSPEQREIRCKMVGTPGIMLEIFNPCTGDILFDSHGLPVSQKAGHGLGIQSIWAFCRKNQAVCQFDLVDGWFRFRLVL
ncbi:MAG: sensor histidine kinase [Acutalibacter sp.]